MNERDLVPSPDFKAEEVDQLIAEFGVAVSPEKREELHQHLGSQKEQFLAMDHSRQHGRGQNPGLSR